MKRRSLIALALAALAVPAVAAPLAMRPLTITPDRPPGPAAEARMMPGLSGKPGIVLTRAYGADDEDCIFKITRAADGKKQRELICR